MIFNKIKSKITPESTSTLKLILFTFLLFTFLISYIWIRQLQSVFVSSISLLNQLEEKTNIDFLIQAGEFFASLIWISVISIILLNFYNIFKLFIFYSVIYTSLGIAIILNLIYRHESIYIISDQMETFLEPGICFYSWSTISVQSILTSSLGFTFIYIIIQESWYFYIKLLLWILITLLISFINLCIFCYKIYTISDIILSSILGLLIFFYFMFIINKDYNKGFDMKIFLNNTYVIIWIFNITTIVLGISLYFINEYILEKDSAENTNSFTHSNCFFEYEDKIVNMSYQSIIYLNMFVSNIGCLLGIGLDRRFLYKEENIWRFYNFNNDQNELESMYSFNDDIRNAQWNETGLKETSIRVILSVLYEIICICFILFIKESDNILFVILKYGLSAMIHTVGLFFLLKFAFVKLNLVNSTINMQEDFIKKTSISTRGSSFNLN